MTLQAMLL